MSRTFFIRRPGAAAALLAGAMVLAGCGTQGVYSIPLPGGADTGSDPLKISADFADVVDLVPQSSVKFNGVTVGKVTSIGLAPDGWSARLDMQVRSDVELPANTRALVQQTNLLGEKYIELEGPETEAPQGRLRSGDVISLDHTDRSAEIEEVFGALSMLLNGGGIAQLQPIVTELNAALGGREPRVRQLFEDFTSLVAGLDEQRADIVAMFDSLGVLSGTVARQRDQIGLALEELPEGIEILADQSDDFTAMLGQLDRLGEVGADVINQTRDDIIADLRALQPTVRALADSSDALIGALPILPTFPVPDEILPAIKGGYGNVWLVLDLRLGQQLEALGVGQPDPVYVKPYGDHHVPVDLENPWIMGNGPRAGWPTVSLLPILDGAPPFHEVVGASTPAEGGLLPGGLDDLLPDIPGLTEPDDPVDPAGEGE